MGSSPTARPLLLGLVFLAGCGPTPQEMATGVGLASPIVYLLSAGLLYPLYASWGRRLEGRSPFQIHLMLALIAVAGLCLVGGESANKTSQTDGFLALTLLAVIFFGTSYLAVTLVVLRAWMVFAERSAYRAPVAVMVLYLLPTIPLALMGAGVKESSGWATLLIFLWIIPGYGGIATLPVYLLLLAEALLRGERGEARPPFFHIPKPKPSALPGFEPPSGLRDPKLRCPYCHDALADNALLLECPACRTILHRICAQELGGCTTMGCARAVTG